MQEKSCAFTGPRPHRFDFGENETDPRCIRLKKELAYQIELMYMDRNVRTFYSGASMGVDMWAGEVVIDLMKRFKDIKLYCIVPYEEQATKWPVSYQDRYYNMLEASTDVKTLAHRYDRECYKRRNQYLVDHADYLLAVYGSSITPRSGTHQTVNMARRRGKAVLAIDPSTFNSTFIDFNINE